MLFHECLLAVDAAALTLAGVDLDVALLSLFTRACFGGAIALLLLSTIAAYACSAYEVWYPRRVASVYLCACGSVCGSVGVVLGGVTYDRLVASGVSGSPGAALYLCIFATLLSYCGLYTLWRAYRIDSQPKSVIAAAPTTEADPASSSSESGNVFVSPWDNTTVWDVLRTMRQLMRKGWITHVVIGALCVLHPSAATSVCIAVWLRVVDHVRCVCAFVSATAVSGGSVGLVVTVFYLVGVLSMQWVVNGRLQCSLSRCCVGGSSAEANCSSSTLVQLMIMTC